MMIFFEKMSFFAIVYLEINALITSALVNLRWVNSRF